MIDTYTVLVFIHVMLFVYWLGADFGVFFLAGASAKAGTPYDIRMAIRRVTILIDLAPRVALILMLPLGLQLATRWGLDLATPVMTLIWIASLAWLGLMLGVHHYGGKPGGELMRAIDFGLRLVMIVVLVSIAIYSLMTGGPMPEPWIAAKLLIYGLLIALGVTLRLISAQTMKGFALLAEGREEDGQAIVGRFRPFSAATALTLWTGLIVAAFIGISKPF